MRNRRRSVLIADHNRATAQGLRFHLERNGFSVFVAHDCEQAAILAARQRFELIFANLELPDDGAADFCRHVREELGLVDVPIVICAPVGPDADLEALQFRYAISRIVTQPFELDELISLARESVEYLVSAS